jgi:hypothetical protein
VLVKRFLLAGACLATAPAAALAQYPVGYEFLVNAYTTGSQSAPAVASDGHGNFVVVWSSYGGLYGRRFSAYGVPLGGDFLVAADTGGPHAPGVAVSTNGNFVVVWNSADGSDSGIRGRRFDASGAPLGGAFPVNSYTTNRQALPAVGAAANGDFVVTWQSLGQNGPDNYGVFAQRFDASGAAQGTEFRVSTYTAGYFGSQFLPTVDSDPAGNFVIVWVDHFNFFGNQAISLKGHRYDAAGVPQGTEFQVNAITASTSSPDVAVDGSGNFVVVWSNTSGGFPFGDSVVMGRRFDAGGTPQGSDFQVNTNVTGAQGSAAVDMDADGDFAVVWHSSRYGGSLLDSGVFAQQFDASGAPVGSEFRVNSYTTGQQRGPAIASSPDENFVVVWESAYQDGDNRGVIGQLYGDLVFRDGFETGDLSRWDAAQTGGGDLTVSGAAALAGTTAGLQAVVDDTNPLFVQDDTPDGENRYTARFYFDTNGFDPGEANGRRRVRLFIAFDSANRRVITIVLRRLNGEYSVMARVRLSDGTRANTPFVPITDGPHFVEFRWARAGTPGVFEDGVFRFFVDNVAAANMNPLDTAGSPVDFVRLGALTLKPGASGTLLFDQFASRRIYSIGAE